MRQPSRLGLLLAFLIPLYSFPLFAQTGGDQVAAITGALRAQEFSKALQLLQPALQRSPNSAQLWTLKALAYQGQGQDKDALSSFRSALKIAPDYLPALEGAGQLEYTAGSKAAVPLLEHVLRLQPNELTSHAMLAVLAYKDGDCAGAVKHFAESGALLDSQPEALQRYGGCLVRLNQMDKAVVIFQRVLSTNPNDARARYQLASVQLMAEQPKDAIETLTPPLQGSDVDVKTLELAALAYEAAGDTPQAVRTLRRAIVANPRDVDLYLDFTNISIDHQSFQVGIDVINSGLKLQPDAAQLYVARGILYVQLAQYDEAESDFDKANAIDPAQSIGAAAQGLEAVQKNDPDRALPTVQAKLAKKPNDPFLLYLQADILSQKGPDPGSPEFQKALRSAKKAVALQPSLTAAHHVLTKLYLQAGQNQAAIEQCKEVLSIDPKDQTALYHLIQALRKTGAKSELPDLLKRLADLRAESTKQERARNSYRLIEENDPANRLKQE